MKPTTRQQSRKEEEAKKIEKRYDRVKSESDDYDDFMIAMQYTSPGPRSENDDEDVLRAIMANRK